MPDLGWDIAETKLLQETQGNNNTHMTLILQTVVTINIMLATFLEHIAACAMKIPKLKEKIAQAVKSTLEGPVLLKKQVHTGQEGLSTSSSRQMEHPVMRSDFHHLSLQHSPA